MKISLDLGLVLFNSTIEPMPFGKTKVRHMAEGSLAVLYKWETLGHELSVISKIDPENEARVTMSLVHAGLVPHIIDPLQVRFCYNRADKGSIAMRTRPDVHIDDRVEPMNAIHAAGVKWKIFFTMFHDDRQTNSDLNFGSEQGLFIARNWEEVEHIVASLPSLY